MSSKWKGLTSDRGLAIGVLKSESLRQQLIQIISLPCATPGKETGSGWFFTSREKRRTDWKDGEKNPNPTIFIVSKTMGKKKTVPKPPGEWQPFKGRSLRRQPPLGSSGLSSGPRYISARFTSGHPLWSCQVANTQQTSWVKTRKGLRTTKTKRKHASIFGSQLYTFLAKEKRW